MDGWKIVLDVDERRFAISSLSPTWTHKRERVNIRGFRVRAFWVATIYLTLKRACVQFWTRVDFPLLFLCNCRQFSSIQISLGSYANWLLFVRYIDLENKILWFFENHQNWFMSSFIPSSKSDMIVNTILQNNCNRIMETTPSRSAYHSKFVTIFF